VAIGKFTVSQFRYRRNYRSLTLCVCL